MRQWIHDQHGHLQRPQLMTLLLQQDMAELLDTESCSQAGKGLAQLFLHLPDMQFHRTAFVNAKFEPSLRGDQRYRGVTGSKEDLASAIEGLNDGEFLVARLDPNQREPHTVTFIRQGQRHYILQSYYGNDMQGNNHTLRQWINAGYYRQVNEAIQSIRNGRYGIMQVGGTDDILTEDPVWITAQCRVNLDPFFGTFP